MSMFIRTRQSSGLLLILANSTSQYLRLWLEEGRVNVQVNNFETFVGQESVSDGHFHLVTVKLEGTEAHLFQSARSQGSVTIRPIQAQPGDLVFMGGLPDSRASASFGGYFKGCVQDLRINNKRLQFYPIATPVESYNLDQAVNVVQGCISDDACAVSYITSVMFIIFSELETRLNSLTAPMMTVIESDCFLFIRSTPVSIRECVTPCGMPSPAAVHLTLQGSAVRR